MRGLVSSDRRRYFYATKDGNQSFDLDLTYITTNIIGESPSFHLILPDWVCVCCQLKYVVAMSWPGSGLETAWRNSLDEVILS